MQFNNVRAFLTKLPLKEMNGQEKFLALAFFSAEGKPYEKIEIKQVLHGWRKSLLGSYSPNFYSRAQEKGWVNPDGQGICVVSDGGVEYLTNIYTDKEINTMDVKQSGALIIVNRKGTQTFDKLIRKIISSSKKEILIADSWVDKTIFDNILDSASANIILKFIYMKDSGGFVARIPRFKRQYSKFDSKKYKDLHDRFLIADDIGYIIGPSLKDAASNSPALVVKLGIKETRLLKYFFNELWKISK